MNNQTESTNRTSTILDSVIQAVNTTEIQPELIYIEGKNILESVKNITGNTTESVIWVENITESVSHVGSATENITESMNGTLESITESMKDLMNDAVDSPSPSNCLFSTEEKSLWILSLGLFSVVLIAVVAVLVYRLIAGRNRRESEIASEMESTKEDTSVV